VAIQHLQPQFPKGQLDIMRDINYQKAQKFYEQRYEAWKNFMKANLSNGEQNIEEYLIEKIEKQWGAITGYFWGGYNGAKKSSNYKKYIQNLKAKTFEHKFAKEMLLKWASTNGQNPAIIVGNSYEPYVTSVMQDFAKAIAGLSENMTDDLLQTFIRNTGSDVSKSALIEGSKNVRPDIIVGGESYKSENGVLKSNGVDVELQGEIDLNPDSVIDELSDLAELYNNANLYGFSLKAWSKSNSKEFTQSSVLRKQINDDFMQTDDKGSRHAWDRNYVMNYMLWKVSSKIINLIGPTNIGLVTGKTFTPFSTWLNNHLFYMDVQMSNVRKDNKKKGMPELNSSAVRIRDYDRNNQILIDTLKKKNGKWFIRLKTKKIT